jgi:hypothetical protein
MQFNDHQLNSDKWVFSPRTYEFKFNPERSEWRCYMFGNTPETNDGLAYNPLKGREPNWFVRWMMKFCFDCTWIKEKNHV